MIICSIKDNKLVDVINNYYISTKEELDKYIHNTYINTVIEVEDDFIADQFTNKGQNFIDYVELIRFIKPFINFLYNDKVVDNASSLAYKLSFIANPRTFALFALQYPQLLDIIKYHVNNISNKEVEYNLLKARLMHIERQLSEKVEENIKLESNNKLLSENNILLNSRLMMLKKDKCTINVEKYNVCIYLKENDNVQYTYTLLSFLRNMLTERNISSSVLVMIPSNSNILYYKWKERGFVDLRLPLVNELLNTKKVVADESSTDNIDIFVNNTVQSKVLIILDKTLSSSCYAVGDNIKLIDIGNNYLKGYTHLGEPPVIENFNNKDIFRFGKIYSENKVLSSLLNEVAKYV